MKFCEKCGKEIMEEAVVCPGCGCAVESVKEKKKKKPLHKKWWFWSLIVFIIIGIAAGGSSNGDIPSTSEDNNAKNETPSVPEEFAQPCPVTAEASVSDNSINYPVLNLNIKNNTDKQISAIQIYFYPKDVYGEPVNTVLTANKLYSDNTIESGETCSKQWQLLDQKIKSGDVYIYSVYFSDGSEWGNKDASDATIKKHGLKLIAES